MSTAATMLSQVNTAIQNILSGGAVKSFSINGRSFTSTDLSELIRLRSILQREVVDEQRNSSFYLAKTSGGTGRRRFQGE